MAPFYRLLLHLLYSYQGVDPKLGLAALPVKVRIFLWSQRNVPCAIEPGKAPESLQPNVVGPEALADMTKGAFIWILPLRFPEHPSPR